MKRIKFMAVSLLVGVSAILPVLVTAPAMANPLSLQCQYEEIEFPQTGTIGCDLSLTKQVSVNESGFQDADSADQALAAKIGDTVTWKITVTNASEQGYEPFGIVTVHDVPPAGVTVTGSSASTGTYSNGDWTFTIEQNLPATLTITSTATSAGLQQNTATLTDYTPDNCDGPCQDPPYVDSNSANNSNSAFVNIAAASVPVAATVPAAPSTGFGVYTKNPVLVLATSLLGSSALLGSAYGIRRYAVKKHVS